MANSQYVDEFAGQNTAQANPHVERVKEFDRLIWEGKTPVPETRAEQRLLAALRLVYYGAAILPVIPEGKRPDGVACAALYGTSSWLAAKEFAKAHMRAETQTNGSVLYRPDDEFLAKLSWMLEPRYERHNYGVSPLKGTGLMVLDVDVLKTSELDAAGIPKKKHELYRAWALEVAEYTLGHVSLRSLKEHEAECGDYPAPRQNGMGWDDPKQNVLHPYIVRTGGGGLHLYVRNWDYGFRAGDYVLNLDAKRYWYDKVLCKWNDEHPNSIQECDPNKLAALSIKVEVKYDNMYVVGPGSVHASGNEYAAYGLDLSGTFIVEMRPYTIESFLLERGDEDWLSGTGNTEEANTQSPFVAEYNPELVDALKARALKIKILEHASLTRNPATLPVAGLPGVGITTLWSEAANAPASSCASPSGHQPGQPGQPGQPKKRRRSRKTYSKLTGAEFAAHMAKAREVKSSYTKEQITRRVLGNVKAVVSAIKGESGFLSQGGRNNFLSRKAYGFMNRYLLHKDAKQLMLAVSALNDRLCSPPLPDSEVEEIVVKCLSKGLSRNTITGSAYLDSTHGGTKELGRRFGNYCRECGTFHVVSRDYDVIAWKYPSWPSLLLKKTRKVNAAMNEQGKQQFGEHFFLPREDPFFDAWEEFSKGLYKKYAGRLGAEVISKAHARFQEMMRCGTVTADIKCPKHQVVTRRVTCTCKHNICPACRSRLLRAQVDHMQGHIEKLLAAGKKARVIAVEVSSASLDTELIHRGMNGAIFQALGPQFKETSAFRRAKAGYLFFRSPLGALALYTISSEDHKTDEKLDLAESRLRKAITKRLKLMNKAIGKAERFTCQYDVKIDEIKIDESTMGADEVVQYRSGKLTQKELESGVAPLIPAKPASGLARLVHTVSGFHVRTIEVVNDILLNYLLDNDDLLARRQYALLLMSLYYGTTSTFRSVAISKRARQVFCWPSEKAVIEERSKQRKQEADGDDDELQPTCQALVEVENPFDHELSEAELKKYKLTRKDGKLYGKCGCGMETTYYDTVTGKEIARMPTFTADGKYRPIHEDAHRHLHEPPDPGDFPGTG